MSTNPLSILREYWQRVEEAYGLYLDATTAMSQWTVRLEKFQQEAIRRLSYNPAAPKNIEEMDQLKFQYGEGDPGTDEAFVLHESSQGELKARNREGGANEHAMGRAFLIAIYQLWEDHYRAAFATQLGKKKNDIMSDLFGELKIMRNGIIHNRNRAPKETKKCEHIDLFEPGDEIKFDKNEVKLLVWFVRETLIEIRQIHLR